MLKGTVVYAGNDHQPCLVDYKIKVVRSKYITRMKVLLTENQECLSTAILNNEFTTYSAVKAVLNATCYGVRYDLIDVYCQHGKLDEYDDSILISRVPLKWKPQELDYTPLNLNQKLALHLGHKVEREAVGRSYHILVGQDDFFCSEPYYAGHDFDEDERMEKYQELCDLFGLTQSQEA
ncbi:hypothetical protein [Photobacterium marinum]|uniref:hypothetical protein n=1 Tax=Photobacterium marinum TaxID=1056511 RepID=UPI0012F8649D|nr:hypothetical protein [Photobacterium marinum]